MFGLRGQSSVEYLSIVAVALMILVPSSYLFFDFSQGSTDQVSASQLNLIGNTIIHEAEKMFVLGSDSWVTIDISFPNSLDEAKIVDGKEMYFSYASSKGSTYVVFFTPSHFNISNSTDDTCTDECDLGFSPGVNNIRIQSRSDLGNVVSVVKI